MLGKYLAIMHKLYCFLLRYFPTSEAAQGAPEIHFHILCLTRVVTSIFYVLIYTRYEPVLQRNLDILYEKYIGENIARGGTPLWRKNRFFFIQKIVRNRLVWGMGNVTIFIFQIKKKPFESHKNCPGQSYFHILEFIFPFFD